MARVTHARIAAHISFWLVYIVLNAILACILLGEKLPQGIWPAMQVESFSLPVKIALTYFVFYYLIPLYLDRSKLVKLVGLTLAAFIAAAVLYRISLLYVYFPLYEPERPTNFWHAPGILLTFFDLFITVAAATTIKMVRVHYESLEFEQQLQKEKLQSELSFLRAQTNPHFLFNTLNNLYGLARKKSDKTAEAILMLSKIMRFVLHDCRAPQIRIVDETKVIRDFIELEKLRYNERLQVDYSEALDNPDTPIAPLLLLPFVENSFKHGAGGTTGAVRIAINLHLHQNHLNFVVENTVDEDMESPAPGGIGLKNVQRQLDLLYPGHYDLQTGIEDGQFKVQLELDLSEAP